MAVKFWDVGKTFKGWEACMGSPYLSLQQTRKRFLCLVVVLTFHVSTKACVVLVPAFHFSKQAGAFYVLTLCVMPGD